MNHGDGGVSAVRVMEMVIWSVSVQYHIIYLSQSCGGKVEVEAISEPTTGGTTQHHPRPATCLSACLQDAMPQLFCDWLSDIAQLQPVFWFDALLVCVTGSALLVVVWSINGKNE